MPTYVYECKSCKHHNELILKMAVRKPKWCKCEECGKRAVRIITAPLGIQFKGSGFYSTDNGPGSTDE